MNKRNLVLSAAVAGALVGMAGMAQAGTISAPATPVNYAVEAITATTDITLPNIVYTMGVDRTALQDVTLIYTLPAGTLFKTTPAVPVISGAGAATVTLKRGGAGTNQVVYDVDVTTAFTTSTVITLTAPVLDNSNLTAPGNSLAVTLDLWDYGETARIDNLTALSKTVATAATAASLSAPACDTGTTTDVNYTTPLAGFLQQGDGLTDGMDVALRAECGGSVRVNNTTAGVRAPDNSADYTLVAGDVVTLTITDPTGFLGLASSGLGYDLSDGNAVGADEVFTVSGNSATRTLAGNLATLNSIHSVLYKPTGTTPMGTSRVLSMAGSIAPAVGSAASLGGTSTWWTWTSNGTTLQSPWFSTAAGYISRFALTNTGTAAATYSTSCLVETGNTATAGSGATGTIPAGGQLVVNASDVCTFSGNTRGAVVFTVNAPSANVQGVYNIVNATTGSISASNMMRPGTN